eukprot:1846565-Rhodomonas_salina.1
MNINVTGVHVCTHSSYTGYPGTQVPGYTTSDSSLHRIHSVPGYTGTRCTRVLMMVPGVGKPVSGSDSENQSTIQAAA